eukprot:s1947_g2.t2
MIGNGATLLIDRILGCEQFSLKRSNKNEAKCHLATHLEATNGLDLPWPSRLERRSIGFDLSGENGFEAMETTAEMVEERLREMQDRGVLKPDELDEHAEAQLRASDPDIALEALSQWETSSFKRRNPSACMVSLLKKLNEQGGRVCCFIQLESFRDGPQGPFLSHGASTAHGPNDSGRADEQSVFNGASRSLETDMDDTAGFTEALVDAYLARLQLRRCAPTLESLQSLLAAHVDRVIYENLDLQLRRPLPPLCFEESVKRVAKGRGGRLTCREGLRDERKSYCFLLVDAFAALLCSLGFRVSLHTATCSAVPEPEVKWGDHVVLVVHLPEGPFIADVGLGEGPRWPFKVVQNCRSAPEAQFAMQKQVEDVFLMTLDDLDDEEKDRLWDIVQMQHQSFVNASAGLDLGPSGAVEPDVAAQQQAEDLMSEMSDKIDASATRSLRSLDPTEALSILHELRHADGIRNHSAFIMSAVKRCNNQGRSSGSRRRDPPRLQQGPYAEEDDGYGYGGFGYDVDNVYGGDDYESHHSDRRNGNSYQDRSRDNRVYGSYDYGSDDGDRYGRYDGGRSGYDRNDRGYEDQSYYEERGSGRRSYIEE